VRTVLLVDDDPGFTYAVSKALAAAGFRTEIAEGSMGGLDLVGTQKPDMLVTDIRLKPGEPHGLAFARIVRSKRRIPILYVTAYPELTEDEIIYGKVLTKPVDVDEIVREVKVELGASA
jgi:two-component system, NtrC family, response regulator GlrR